MKQRLSFSVDTIQWSNTLLWIQFMWTWKCYKILCGHRIYHHLLLFMSSTSYSHQPPQHPPTRHPPQLPPPHIFHLCIHIHHNSIHSHGIHHHILLLTSSTSVSTSTIIASTITASIITTSSSSSRLPPLYLHPHNGIHHHLLLSGESISLSVGWINKFICRKRRGINKFKERGLTFHL